MNIINNTQKPWIAYIKNRIENNKNFIGFIGGPTGSGKSWSSLSIAEQLDPNFSIKNVVFKSEELMELINGGSLTHGSVIIFEEAGIELSNRNWQSSINKLLNYLFQTFRHRRFILIMNSPYMDFIDASTRKLFHAEFITQKIDKEKQHTIIKPQLIQYNPRMRKFYYKYLRIAVKGAGIGAIKAWRIEKPSQKIIDAYEQKKTLFTQQLNIEIQETLQKKSEKKEERIYTCLFCGYEWKPRGKSPSRCPKCSKTEINEVQSPKTATDTHTSAAVI